jgi:septal ring factor EnvC (AmiA/AmiB activator)
MDLKVITADIEMSSVSVWLIAFRSQLSNPKAERMDKEKLISDVSECINSLDESAKGYKSLQDEWRLSRQRNYDLERYIINQLNDLSEKDKEIARLNCLVEELKKGL